MSHFFYVIACYITAFLLLGFNFLLTWLEWQRTVRVAAYKSSGHERNI